MSPYFRSCAWVGPRQKPAQFCLTLCDPVNCNPSRLLYPWNSSVKNTGVGCHSLLHSSVGKESTCNAGDLGSIPGLGRSPGEGKAYPLQCSGMENPTDYTVPGVAKSQTRLSDFHFTSQAKIVNFPKWKFNHGAGPFSHSPQNLSIAHQCSCASDKTLSVTDSLFLTSQLKHHFLRDLPYLQTSQHTPPPLCNLLAYFGVTSLLRNVCYACNFPSITVTIWLMSMSLIRWYPRV